MPTYTFIASNTVGSGGAASVTFSSIPATYTDLIIKISARTTRSAIEDSIFLRFNGDSASNYVRKNIYGDGTSIVSGDGAYNSIDFYACGDTATANTFGNAEIIIPSYASANNKSLSIDGVTENNATSTTTLFKSGIWNNTSAITTISFTPNVGTFKQYSTFTLYGISNA